MDIRGFKKETAGMLGTLLQIDPQTGLPYAPPSPLVGAKTKAYAQTPFSASEIELPFWIILASRATYPYPPDRSIARLSYENRDFDLLLYGCIANTGVDGEAERKVEPYLDPARNLIQSHPLFYDNNISDVVPGIQQVALLKDDGLVVLKFGPSDDSYLGLRFTVRVEGRNVVTYGNE